MFLRPISCQLSYQLQTHFDVAAKMDARPLPGETGLPGFLP